MIEELSIYKILYKSWLNEVRNKSTFNEVCASAKISRLYCYDFRWKLALE